MRGEERGVDHYVIAEAEGSLSTWRNGRAIRMGAGLRDEGSLSARGKGCRWALACCSWTLGAVKSATFVWVARQESSNTGISVSSCDIRVGGSSISPQIVFRRLGGA